MFWVDEIAKNLKDNKQHITDGKTPSGRIHVGSLRGVLIHDAVYQALKNQGAKVKFSYTFDDMDAFDRVPAGLDEKVFGEYIGMPLYKVPSPEPTAANFAEFFAVEFMNVFKKMGAKPEIIWQSKLHEEGTLNEAIKIALDNAEKIQDIYQQISGSKKREQGWLPFQPICQKCGRIGTTKTIGWDGKEVTYECLPDLVIWAKGCNLRGKISPFNGGGKLPWKIYWPARWYALKTTIEGQGKDLASKGGARDVANHIARQVYRINPPRDIPYEFFLFGGAKMSTSKGIGVAASEVIEILPAEIVRFLMLRSRPMQAINFDPTDPQTIPKLFDDYDKENPSQLMRFSDVVTLLQMPGKEKELERSNVKPRVAYAKIWLDRFVPEEQKFTVKEEFPEQALHLSGLQKIFLGKIVDELAKDLKPETFEVRLYELTKEVNLSSKDAFAAIYNTLIGKDHGPKAGQLIVSLDKEFVIKRFREAVG